MDVNDFIEALEVRLELIRLDLQKKGKHDPWDLFFDVQNALKEVKCQLVT